ncbi:MAG: D-alanyl-D-alanine carboxypeptidase/D-alanyl-D-alanine endopeptidase, partial [Gammaproteobacteria bacterium]
KTFSTAAVLDSYGADYRFRTPVYHTGALKQGVLEGDLVLVASGDLSLGLRERPDGTLAFNNAPEYDHTYANTGLAGPALVPGDPFAGLNRLAQNVRNAGIREIRGNVVIDDRLFTPFSGWSGGLISSIWVNDNRIDITITPTDPGKPAAVDWRPKTAAYTVESAVETVAHGRETTLEVDAPNPGVFRIHGRIASGHGPALRVGEIAEPAAFARMAFIEALERAGVRVRAAARGPNPSQLLPPPGSYRESQRIAEQVSAPLKEFIKVILKVSHGPGADLMACLVAVKAGSRNCEEGLKREFEVFTRFGFPPESTFLFDGAGGDERDRTTPAAVTAFLRALAEQSYGAVFRRGLPVLGVDGTLAQTQVGSPASGHVQAKTGRLTGVTPADQVLITALTLVGYAEAKSGRPLVLAIMVRDVPVPSLQEITAVDADLGALAAAIQQGY